MTGTVGEVGPAPWPPLWWIPIATPYGAAQFLSGALTIPGAPFDIAAGQRVAVWFCRE